MFHALYTYKKRGDGGRVNGLEVGSNQIDREIRNRRLGRQTVTWMQDNGMHAF